MDERLQLVPLYPRLESPEPCVWLGALGPLDEGIPCRNQNVELGQLVGAAGEERIEIHVAAPVSTCAERDVKGLYAKALAGEIKNFTGVSDPYEPPAQPEITLHTEAESVDDSVHQVIAWLEANQLTAPSDR